MHQAPGRVVARHVSGGARRHGPDRQPRRRDDHRRGAPGARPRRRWAAPTERLLAELVVDASGRGSHTPRWLEALGYAPPEETRINSFLAYASRYYAPPEGFRAGLEGLFFNARPPPIPRGGALFPVEGGRWLVTSPASATKRRPSTTRASWPSPARCAAQSCMRSSARPSRSRPSPAIGGPKTYFATTSGWPAARAPARHRRRRLRLQPDLRPGHERRGAGCPGTPPLPARPNTARPRRRSDRAGARFQKAVAAGSATPWLMATGEDLRYPTTEGAQARVGSRRLLQRYFDRVNLAATDNVGVNRAFGQVLNLLAPPSALFLAELLPGPAGTRGARTTTGRRPRRHAFPLRPCSRA